MSKLLNVKMTLRDVLYISYSVTADSLRPLVPDVLRLATVDGDNAFISLVILQSTKVRLGILPFIHFNYHQFNIRTYVVDPVSGQQAVYFIRSGVTSRFISMATRSAGIPWQLIDLKVHLSSPKEWKNLSVSGNWEGKFSIESRSGKNVSAIPSLFENKKSAVDFLIRPLIGLAGDKRRPVRFTIQHPEVEPENWSLIKLDCPFFQKLCPVEDYSNPHSVFFLPTADFSIFLPPARVK